MHTYKYPVPIGIHTKHRDENSMTRFAYLVSGEEIAILASKQGADFCYKRFSILAESHKLINLIE